MARAYSHQTCTQMPALSSRSRDTLGSRRALALVPTGSGALQVAGCGGGAFDHVVELSAQVARDRQDALARYWHASYSQRIPRNLEL